MFGVPINGSAIVLCDNESVHKNTITPEYVLKKKNHYISYNRCMEAVSDKSIRVAKQVTENNLSDIITKIITSARRVFLLENFTY